MTGLDPGWFYSTLAQSSAAIVGLIGAILGTRIIEHLATMRGERGTLRKRISSVRQIVENRIKHLTEYRRFLVQDIEDDRRALAEGHAKRRSDVRMGWASTGSGSQHDDVSAEGVSSKQRILEVLDRLVPQYAQLPQEISASQTREYAERLRVAARDGAGAPDHLGNKPEGFLLNDAQALEEIADLIDGFRRKLIPGSHVVVFFTLGWIAVVGIIWPLRALPGLPAYPRDELLVGFGLGLLFLIAYFAYQFIELRLLSRGVNR